MIPRRSSGESCSGFGSDERRSSILRSMCSWIGAVGDRLAVISREISGGMARSFGRWNLPANRGTNKIQAIDGAKLAPIATLGRSRSLADVARDQKSRDMKISAVV